MIQSKKYRKNVALIAYRGIEFILVNLEVWPKDYWKFPQGGIIKGETEEAAVFREFKEELGSDKIKITSKSNIKRKYKWDKPKVIDGIEYVGQDQTFFIVEYLGSKNELQPQQGEIRQFCFAKKQDLEKLIKREELDFEDYWQTIERVLNEGPR